MQPLSESPLIVFVSSLIDRMRRERDAVDRAIRSIPITRPWLFENTPASSLEVEESYLSKIRECHIFVLLLGYYFSAAVAREYQTAVENERPILAFVQVGEKSTEQNEFIHSLRTKYAFYSQTDDLHDKVYIAILDELIRRFKSTLRPDEIPKIIQSLPVSVPKREEKAKYIIIGMENNQAGKMLFERFGGITPPENHKELYLSLEEVYFDSLDEMQEVFTALNNATIKAQRNSDNRQKAFERALKEEAIAIARRYIVRQRSQNLTPQIVVPGLKYFVWGLAPDVARIIRLMRPEELRGRPRPVQRTASEFFFKDVGYFLKVLEEIQRAGQGWGGDANELQRLLDEGARRLRSLRPDDEDD